MPIELDKLSKEELEDLARKVAAEKEKRRACPTCKRPYEPYSDALRTLQELLNEQRKYTPTSPFWPYEVWCATNV